MSHYQAEETAAVHADAAERSVRSFIQGFLLDVAVATILVLATAFSAIEWTPTYWKLLGLTLAKSVLQAAVSYFMRMVVVPRRSVPG
jgi:heme/copper-type cytochrome/quinol oxidase subunit 4